MITRNRESAVERRRGAKANNNEPVREDGLNRKETHAF